MSEQEDLQREHGDLLQFFYTCPVALAQLGATYDVQFANPAFAQLMLQIDPHGGMFDLVGVLSRFCPQLPELVEGLSASTGVICEDLRFSCGRPSPAAPFPLVLSLSLTKAPRGLFLVTILDVSRAAAHERAASEAEDRLRAIVDGVRDYAIFTLDGHARVATWNLSAEKLFGHTASETVGRSLEALMPDEEKGSARVRRLLAGAESEGWAEDEGWWARLASTRFWGNAIISAVEDGGGFTVILRDLSQRKRSEDDLRRRANTDPLTGLYTRRFLEESAERELFQAERSGTPASLLMVDADHFKRINDRHGHPAGDKILEGIARICRDQTRDIDIVARYGGEEIVLLIPATDAIGARAAAERIRRAIEAHQESYEGVILRVTVSVGVAQSRPGDTLGELLARADAALYEGKRRGRNQVVVAESEAPTAAAS